ncbi:MAG: hypothetical protein HRT44_13120 [Bdellovibrionales bacterium]|nr:hypothetical protein [Bdellovibrionales bacterium]
MDEALIRWAFEGRGVDTRGWNMEISHFNPRSLAPAIRRMPDFRRISSRYDFGNPQQRQAGCEMLRNRSRGENAVQDEETEESPDTVE